MASWAYGWQFDPTYHAYIQQAVAPDPSPSPGFGQVTVVYDYASGHQLLYYMPDYLQHDPYIRDLMDAMGEEISVLRATLDRVLEQFFFEQTVEWGLQLWEAEAGVAVNPDGVSDLDRRAAIKSRIVIGPRTLADFQAWIDNYFEDSTAVITENYASYSIDVTIYDYKSPEEQAAFEDALRAALPAHLALGTVSYGGFIAGVSTAGDTL
ncbi:MAG: putative phage tail protein [Halobacteriales archaeon]|nr:putative phage tail protein [Halobacteriales archaeon]